MTRSKKRIDRLLSRPRDMSSDELVTILEHDGFENKHGSGSHALFKKGSAAITVPLNKSSLGRYLLDQAIAAMELE